MTVSVVVVSYNVKDWIVRCLGSLAAATSHDLDVIVVDNASRDGSAEAVEVAFPEVTVVRNAHNLGFGRAANQGAELATGDYLLLLNPDGYAEPGSLDALVAFAQRNPQYVIVGGRTISPEGELDPRSCWAAPTLWSLASSAAMLSTLRPRSPLFDPEAMGDFGRDHARPVDIVTGCLLLVRMADWRALGGFDERFFMYGEDAELCLRAAAETGRQCAVTPEATMVHAVGASSATRPDKHEILLAGRITLVRTHWGPVRGRPARRCWWRASAFEWRSNAPASGAGSAGATPTGPRCGAAGAAGAGGSRRAAVTTAPRASTRGRTPTWAMLEWWTRARSRGATPSAGAASARRAWSGRCSTRGPTHTPSSCCTTSTTRTWARSGS